MTKDEALRMALEALEECRRDPRLKYEHPTYDKAITAIKEALAQPEQEPVAWMYPDALCDKACLYLCTKGFTQFPECADRLQPKEPKHEPSYWLGYGLQAHTEKPFEGATPVYTTPPQRKPLTDEQIAELCRSLPATQYTTAFARAIEAAHGIGEQK